MRCFFKALVNYADFEGRAGRREFWLFFVIWALLGVFSVWADWRLGSYAYNFRNGLGIFEMTWAVGLLLPWLAVSVRRLHDGDRAGWWVLPFLPLPFLALAMAMPATRAILGLGRPLVWLLFAGGLIYAIIMALPGSTGENRFGRPEPPWC